MPMGLGGAAAWQRERAERASVGPRSGWGRSRPCPGRWVSSGCWSSPAVLGTTFLGNAFQSANSLSNVLFELLAAGALSAVLVPTFVKLLDARR